MRQTGKILNIFTKPQKLVRILGRKNMMNWLPDKPYIQLAYWAETGNRLNLDNPKTYNEKLQWIKLYDRKPEYCIYVDKFAVRSHIKETIGEKYLIPIIDVYDRVEEINWELLPDQFVLKCTHGSGTNIICKDKSKLDIEEATKRLKRWMKKNWYWFGREWPYKSLKPRIICEPYLSDTNALPNDYKVMCFNGKAKLIQVHTGRYVDHKVDFFNLEWEKVNVSPRASIADSNFEHAKPECLEEMIQLSERIAENKYHVRVDWFIVNKKLYFGEITFFETSGFIPFENEEDDYMLGSWIELPIRKT